jgi:hypothetical protein
MENQTDDAPAVSSTGLLGLLACPFCGGRAEEYMRMDEALWSHEDVPWRRIACASCDCSTPDVCDGAEPTAAAIWNNRPNAKLTDRQ